MSSFKIFSSDSLGAKGLYSVCVGRHWVKPDKSESLESPHPLSFHIFLVEFAISTIERYNYFYFFKRRKSIENDVNLLFMLDLSSM